MGDPGASIHRQWWLWGNLEKSSKGTNLGTSFCWHQKVQKRWFCPKKSNINFYQKIVFVSSSKRVFLVNFDAKNGFFDSYPFKKCIPWCTFLEWFKSYSTYISNPKRYHLPLNGTVNTFYKGNVFSTHRSIMRVKRVHVNGNVYFVKGCTIWYPGGRMEVFWRRKKFTHLMSNK